jgi:hypothetical protein
MIAKSNVELIQYNGAASELTDGDRLRRLILWWLEAQQGCPSCMAPLNYFEAAGISCNDLLLESSRSADTMIGELAHITALRKDLQCPRCRQPILFEVDQLSYCGWSWRRQACPPMITT